MKIVVTGPTGQILELEVDSFPVLIGRQKPSVVKILHPQISGQHAEIHRTESGYEIRDLNSTNGVWMDGHRVSSHPLDPPCKVQLGSEIFLQVEVEMDKTVIAPSIEKTTISRVTPTAAAAPAPQAQSPRANTAPKIPAAPEIHSPKVPAKAPAAEKPAAKPAAKNPPPPRPTPSDFHTTPIRVRKTTAWERTAGQWIFLRFWKLADEMPTNSLWKLFGGMLASFFLLQVLIEAKAVDAVLEALRFAVACLGIFVVAHIVGYFGKTLRGSFDWKALFVASTLSWFFECLRNDVMVLWEFHAGIGILFKLLIAVGSLGTAALVVGAFFMTIIPHHRTKMITTISLVFLLPTFFQLRNDAFRNRADFYAQAFQKEKPTAYRRVAGSSISPQEFSMELLRTESNTDSK